MTEKLILTDVDDTVLKFADHFQAYVESRGIPTYGELRTVYSLEPFLRMDREETRKLLREYSHDTEGYQPPEECAAEVLPELYKAGYRFVAITACGLDPLFRLKRKRHLEEVFGFRWEDVHVVDLLTTKVPILREFSPSVWVEDSWHHAVDGAGLGHTSYVVSRPYNEVTAQHPEIKRVADWREIRDDLLKTL